MATKTRAYGAQLLRSTNGSSYSALTDIKSIGPYSLEIASAEITTLESVSQMREWIGGWGESGELPFTGYFTKAQFDTLEADAVARTSLYWRVELSLIDTETTKTRFDFRGHVNRIGFDELTTDDQDAIMAPFGIKLTGLPTHTAGS